MQRDILSLVDKEFDLVVIGGGIFGICIAWDAALRGLSVALLERGDFAGATSANCFKMVHGGIRYLQHADLYRVRESCQERRVLLHIAPHLVRPVPIVIPTYGHGLRGKEFLRAGALAYDLLTLDRNRGLRDPVRRIAWGSALSRTETLRLFPALPAERLTGAVTFSDGQIYSPARLALAILKSAIAAGAVAANYAEVVGFLREGNRIKGVSARDLRDGGDFTVRGRMVINASGPWAERVLDRGASVQLDRRLAFSRDAYFVVRRRLTDGYGLAVQGATKDPDAILSRGSRHLFIMPWREHSIVGVWHVVYEGNPDNLTVRAADLQGFLDEINAAYPVGLTLDDVALWGAGLTLFGDNAPGVKDLSYGKRSLVVDHARIHGLEGLLTVIGVRYTTGRAVAERAVDLALQKMGEKRRPCQTANTPVHGGDLERFGDLLRQAIDQRPRSLSPEMIPPLVQNHGSAYGRILAYIQMNPSWAEPLGATKVIKAEVVHAVREEMAQTLDDIVFRRTDLGTAGHPGNDALEACADLMASELGWDAGRREGELARVEAVFPRFSGTAQEPERKALIAAEGGRSFRS